MLEKHTIVGKNASTRYIGQFRLYSLIDLILLLFAAGANFQIASGAILLWLGFLIYLENSHVHPYRYKLPAVLWQVLFIAGVIAYGRIEAIAFIAFAYLYSKKNKDMYGALSPLFRALQSFFLISGITGYRSILPILAFTLIGIRNFAGDLRDIKKDRNSKTLTLPVFLGMKKSIKHVHLIFLLLTSIVWWYFSGLTMIFLIAVLAVEIITYNLTQR